MTDPLGFKRSSQRRTKQKQPVRSRLGWALAEECCVLRFYYCAYNYSGLFKENVMDHVGIWKFSLYILLWRFFEWHCSFDDDDSGEMTCVVIVRLWFHIFVTVASGQIFRKISSDSRVSTFYPKETLKQLFREPDYITAAYKVWKSAWKNF